jgi:hypothetical protein
MCVCVCVCVCVCITSMCPVDACAQLASYVAITDGTGCTAADAAALMGHIKLSDLLREMLKISL